MSSLSYINGITKLSHWINNRFESLHLATHATLHEVNSRAVATSVAVQDVGKYVVHAHPIWALSGSKLRGPVQCLLCSWRQCSRSWQLRCVKTRPTYGRRVRILRTRNRLITVCGTTVVYSMYCDISISEKLGALVHFNF